MRIKLIFLIDKKPTGTGNKCEGTSDNILDRFRKIVFPVNLNEINFISHLKNDINKFILKKGINNLIVENLSLESFLLMDEFEVGLVLNNDDEIKVLLIENEEESNHHDDNDKDEKEEKEEKDENKHIKKKLKNEKLKKFEKIGKIEKAKNVKRLKKTMNIVEIDSNTSSSSESENTSTVKSKTFLKKKTQNNSNQSTTKNNADKFVEPQTLKKDKNKVTRFIPDKSDESDKSSSSSDSDEQLPVKKQKIVPEKKYNFSEIRPSIPKQSYYTNTISNIPKNNYSNSNENYSKEYLKLDSKTVNEKYDIIPSDKIENIEFLETHYPTLFRHNTNILFRIYELSFESGGPAASKYKRGKVDQYIQEYHSFVIKLQSNTSNDSLLNVYGNYIDNNPNDYYESNVISVDLRDFIELRVEKSELNKPVNLNENKEIEIDMNEDNKDNEDNKHNFNININSQVGIIEPISLPGTEITGKKENQFEIEKVKENENENKAIKAPVQVLKPTPKINIFNKIVLPHIKRQVEFYLSDKNYYKDAFLLEKAALDENNYINLEIIMGFNKIKSLSSNKEDIINALKDSNIVEFNSDFTKIKKKIIIQEFLDKNRK